jgi:hypothetical protein
MKQYARTKSRKPRAGRRAAPKPARIPAGDRLAYPPDEEQT